MPTISVVVTTFNRAALVRAAVASVQAQSSPADEIIVVNDGSSDNTREVLDGMAGIVPIHQNNGGISSARNAGIRAAKGDWIAFLDDDDEYALERLAITRESIKRNPVAHIHTTNIAVVSPSGEETDLWKARGRSTTEFMVELRPLTWVLNGCFFVQSAVIRRQVLVDIGLFRNTFYEDLDLFVRLSQFTPWILDSRGSLRLIRRSESDFNVSSFWRSKPVEKYQALVQIHRDALSLPNLNAAERTIVQRALAANLFELGMASYRQNGAQGSRPYWREAALLFPRRSSRLKALAAMVAPGLVHRILESRRQRAQGFVR